MICSPFHSVFRHFVCADSLEICEQATLESQVNWVSLVFTLAALVLLHSIVSGPLPALPEIKDTVRKGAVALRNGPKNSSANCLMWAICVLGSMADGETQPIYDDVLTNVIRSSGRLGNSTAVLEILKKSWSMGDANHLYCNQVMDELDICVLLI
jgi:hypothetical protein